MKLALNIHNEQLIQAYEATLLEQGASNMQSKRKSTMLRNIIGGFESDVSEWDRAAWIAAIKSRCDTVFSERDSMSREALNNYISVVSKFSDCILDENPLEDFSDKEIIPLLGYTVSHKSGEAKKRRSMQSKWNAPITATPSNTSTGRLLQALQIAPLSKQEKLAALEIILDL